MTETTITLLTYNTLGVPVLAPAIKARTKVLAQELEKSAYDIVCLQEVFFHPRISLFKELMPSYPYCVYEKTLFGAKGGLVIFSRLPIEIDSYQEYIIPKEIKTPWYTKINHNGILIVSLVGMPLTIMNTHLTSAGEHAITTKSKLYDLLSLQSHSAAQILHIYAQRKHDVLMVGDFNIAKESELYPKFLNQSQAKDISPKENKPTYYNDRINAVYNAITSDKIDYIFASNKNKYIDIGDTVTYAFDEKFVLDNKKESYLSDHTGLSCTITVKK